MLVHSGGLNTLFPSHLADLRKSGLSDDMIKAMGIESMDSTRLVRRIYGPGSGKHLASDGYAIPYLNLERVPIKVYGAPLARYRIIRSSDDAGPKYLSRVGTPHAVYIPPGLADLLADKEKPLIITEGEKKAAKAVQEGFACVAIPGVYMWFDPGKRSTLDDQKEPLSPETAILPELTTLCAGRRIVVLADSDAAQNKQVKTAMMMLARGIRHQVRTRGTYYASLPVDPSTDKKIGLDDLLCLEDGSAVLEAITSSAESVGAGIRAYIPYDRVRGVRGVEDRVLHYLIPRKAADESWAPKILQERVKDGEVATVPLDVPYAWHSRTIRVVEAPYGEALTNDPEHPVTVVDEIEGVARGQRIKMRIPAEEVSDVKRWESVGYTATPKSIVEWKRLAQASCDSGISESVWGTYKKGWMRFPGAPAPHYIYGDRVIVPPAGEALIALSRSAAAQASASGINQRGLLDEWTRTYLTLLANPCLATLTGFACSAAILANVKGSEPGIINLVGSSGSGKTTMLQAIASLIGSPDRPSSPGSYTGTWRTTDNGMESPLAARSDSVALLDEVHQAPLHTDWQALLYMAANGRGKARMTKEIEERAARAWSVQLISSGEESLASKVRASRHGKAQMPGGLQFRVIDLDVREAGIWSDVAEQAKQPGGGRYSFILTNYGSEIGGATPAKIIEAIERALLTHHGHFWPRLIEWLQSPSNVELVQQVYDSFRDRLDKMCSADASQIVRRRGKHIAAAMTGLAILLEILKAGKAEKIQDQAYDWATKQLWHAGLDSTTGDEGDQMASRLVERILAEPARLYKPGAQWSTRDFWGWITGKGAIYLPTGLGLQSVCADLGFDSSRVRTALLSKGWTEENRRPPQAGVAAGKVRGLMSPPGLLEPSLEAEGIDD